MGRKPAILALVAGCSFAPGGAPGGSASGPDAGAGSAALTCGFTDPSLRLCTDFSEPMTSPMTIRDFTAGHHDATAIMVTPIDRSGNQAALVAATSMIAIAESPDLDLASTITIELWVNPTALPQNRNYLLDNNQQYAMSIGQSGGLVCDIGGNTVQSVPITPGVWTHAACTYDGVNVIAYADGNVAGCSPLTGPIPTIGTDGMAIGARLVGTSFSQQLVGGIDDVHIYDRALASTELCGHAGNATCTTTCPQTGGN